MTIHDSCARLFSNARLISATTTTTTTFPVLTLQSKSTMATEATCSMGIKLVVA